VFGDLAHTQTYCKLQERIDKYDYAAIYVWHCLDEEFSYRNKELNTVHLYIEGKPGAPSVHFAFRRLMPRYRYKGIIKIFKGREWDHTTLVTGWSDFSKRQYAHTFQHRHPTREQTIQEGCILLQLFASRDCWPSIQSRGIACAALRVATRLLCARHDSYG
jgi:hypothetical protein